jgi:hypothetical protein
MPALDFDFRDELPIRHPTQGKLYKRLLLNSLARELLEEAFALVWVEGAVTGASLLHAEG